MPSDDGSPELDALSTALVTRAQLTAGIGQKASLPANKTVSLLVTGGPMRGQNIVIPKAQVLLGRRSPDGPRLAHIVIDDPKVSRKHCVLEVHDQIVLLVDLDSANGTYVDDKKVASSELGHMSEFRIGSTSLTLAIM